MFKNQEKSLHTTKNHETGYSNGYFSSSKVGSLVVYRIYH